MRFPLKSAFLGSTLLLSGILLSSCENETLDTSIVEDSESNNVSIIAEQDSLWPNNTITYTFDSNFNDHDTFEAAVHHWELFTTINFIEATNPVDTDLIVLSTSSGLCTAAVGYRGNLAHSNSVSLSSGCDVASVIHELGHVAGLYHEQNRSDRDDFVTVNFDNIQEGFHSQYEKNEDKGNNALEFTPFDFESIMMYNSNTLSSGGNTMVKKDGSIINRTFILSKYDVIGIESLYNQGSPKTIAISSLINSGDYISSENGRKDITSTREAIGKWERFIVLSSGGGVISLQASNGKFLSVNDETGGLKFSSSSIGSDEKFIATHNTTLNGKFYYTISHNSSELFADDNGELKIDNSGGGGQDTLFAIEILD